MSHSERQVSLWCLAAWAAWTFVLVSLLAGTITGLAGGLLYIEVASALFAHSLVGSAVAATITLRNVIVKRDRLLRNAFDVGRDATELRRVR